MKNGSPNEFLAAQAADWVVALGESDHQTREAFADWLRASPEHIREFLAVSAIWGTLAGVSSQPSVQELVRLATSQSNVVEMPGAGGSGPTRAAVRARPGRRWLGRAAAAAIGAVALAAIVLNLPFGGDPNLHATVVGEQSSVPLPDGSVVTLNTRTSIRVDYSARFRDVHLVDGEALFDVADNDARPFRVFTELALIEAVGTQFSVRTYSGQVTITVVEGIVDVSSLSREPQARTDPDGRVQAAPMPAPVRIRFDQQARVRSGASTAQVVDAAVEKAIAWREQRLIFDALPLEQVIEEFNRYHARPVIIAEQELKPLPISGVFRCDDRASFLQFLSRMELADSAEREDGIIVLTGKSND